MSINLQNVSVLLLAAFGVPAAARAAVVVTPAAQSGVYAVSSTDLINGLTPVTTGTFGPDNGANTDSGTDNPAVLTDGLFGSAAPASEPAEAGNARSGSGNLTLAVRNGATVTYTLPSASDIGSINVYGAWNDNGRDQQVYSVLVSTNGTDFTPLADVNFNPPGSPSPSDTKVSIGTSDGSPLATGVVAIEFNFGAQENGYAGYKEIDVLSTPEPASLSLVGLGALGLLARRRRF